MKKVLLILFVCIFSASVLAVETKYKKIDRVQINSKASDGNTYYYFVNEGGWGATGCVDAIYATMKDTDGGANAFLSLVLSAKATGAEVKFYGSCESTNIYFQVNYVILK